MESKKVTFKYLKCLNTDIEKKIHHVAVKYLSGLAEKHSKSTKIAEEDFGKKAYFSDKRFSKEDIQILFSLRTKMTDSKSNFSNLFDNDLTCRMCKEVNSIEDEDHILICKKLNTERYDAKFADVYSDIEKQYKVTQVYKKVLRRRKIYLEAMT